METTTEQDARPELMDRLADLDACAVSDALDTLSLPGAVTGIAAQGKIDKPLIGRARTVKAGPKPVGQLNVHIASPLVAQIDEGDVIVIDNGGRTDVSCWGGLLGEAAVQRGAAGVVVDGACRDVQEAEELGLALYARAAVTVSARGRIVQESMDEPIQMGTVSVRSGDLVIADWNGVVFIPEQQAEKVIDLAEQIQHRELAMAVAVRSGRKITDVMHDSQFPTVTAD